MRPEFTDNAFNSLPVKTPFFPKVNGKGVFTPPLAMAMPRTFAG